MLWTATWDNPNLFQHIRELRRAVREELEYRGDPWNNIFGIHQTATPCWPIDPEVCSRGDLWQLDNPEKVSIETRHPIRHSAGWKGLLCSVTGTNGDCHARLFDVLPLGSHEKIEKASLNFTSWGHNLFAVTNQLHAMAKILVEREGMKNVRGIHDNEACWPEGLGEIRSG